MTEVSEDQNIPRSQATEREHALILSEPLVMKIKSPSGTIRGGSMTSMRLASEDSVVSKLRELDCPAFHPRPGLELYLDGRPSRLSP